jgi:stage V sporulation protein SpoVS
MIEMSDKQVTFFVSGSTPVTKLGSAIAHGVYAQKEIKLRAIGPGPISQAMKAIACANGYAAPRGIRLAAVPSFEAVTMPDREVTAVVLQVVVL